MPYTSHSVSERESHQWFHRFIHALSYSTGSYAYWLLSQSFMANKLRFRSGKFYAKEKRNQYHWTPDCLSGPKVQTLFWSRLDHFFTQKQLNFKIQKTSHAQLFLFWKSVSESPLCFDWIFIEIPTRKQNLTSLNNCPLSKSNKIST